MWEYIETVVHETVVEYQSEAEKSCSPLPEVAHFSAKDLGAILCKAIANKTSNEVSCDFIITDGCDNVTCPN